ncbi:MAG: L-threonylcarbamoyladenylate synthase [Thermodesulfovibrionales bacterium]
MEKVSLQTAGYQEAIQSASAVIEQGGIVCLPTETFYGLCARYDSPQALSRLYEMKQRPRGKAMPLIIAALADLGLVAGHADEALRRLAGHFWPGPLTLLLPARGGISDLLTAGTGRIAVRVPGASFAYDLVRTIRTPMTATSANLSGMPPAETAEKVLQYFGEGPDLLVDGGKTRGISPSTIIEFEEGTLRIVRQGAIREDDIRRVLSSLKP